jgi:signal transduction histidine kinase
VPFNKRVSELDLRSLIALIALAAGILGLMQYNWFRAWTTVELEGEYRALSAAASQAASREFQRYAAFFDDLRSLNGVSLSDAKSLLSRDYGLYGPNGSAPRLLATVGFTSLGASAEAMRFAPSGIWSSGLSPLGFVSKETRAGLARDQIMVQKAASDTRRFIIAPISDGYLAIVELDVDGFLETYVKPAISAVLPKATIDWSLDQDRSAQARRIGTPSSYKFNPFAALFGGGSKSTRTFEILFPATVEAPIAKGRYWQPSGSASGSKQFEPNIDDAPPELHGPFNMARARVYMPAGSVIGAIERRLALNWLFGTFLLLAMGIAFSLALVEMQKIRSVRKREREFVASITHELRTPVTAIRSAADNMRRGLVGIDRMATYGEMIHSQSLRLGSMIEEVLVFAQVEGNVIPPPILAPVRAAELEAEFRPPLEAIAKAEGITLAWDFVSLPREFLCDAESLRLVLSNLVTNALYHAYPEATKGEVRVVGKSSSPNVIRFTVEDDGRGIAKAESDLVFDPFYRDETSRARHEKGSGLGLFIARRKANLLGGELRLESPYERIDGSRRPGCRFTMELPFKENEHAQ